MTMLSVVAVHRQAAAQSQPIPGLTTTNGALDAKAAPDECFIAVGVNIPFARPNPTTGASRATPKSRRASERSGALLKKTARTAPNR